MPPTPPSSFSSSNRPTGNAISPNTQFDDVTNRLEGTPKIQRGSRKKPSVLKYPIEIGTNEVPHVMQFKIFWRWPRPQFITSNTIKLENEDKLQLATRTLNVSETLRRGGTVPGGGFSELRLLRPFSEKDPTGGSLINLKAASETSEKNISDAKQMIQEVSAEVDRGDGRIVLTEDEKKQRNLEMKTESAIESIATNDFITGGVFVDAVASVVSFIAPSLAPISGIAAMAYKKGAQKVVTVVADSVTNLPVYDQMVSIYLPICTKINNEDTFQYEDAEMKAIGTAMDIAKGGVPGVVDGIAQSVAVGANAIGGDFARQGQTKLLGSVINPRLEKMFKSKDMRTFSFSWEFFPKSKEETKMIRDIIETFRYHSHPSQDEELFGEGNSNVEIMLRVPAEFDIRFLSTNSDPTIGGFVDNEFIPKISRCVINSISVDYTPQGIFTTFEDNAPVAITLTLNMTELQIILRDQIESGY